MKKISMSRVSAFVLILLMAFVPFESKAWGVLGHRVIGEIAALHLNAKAKKEIQKILGNESVAMASNWGDFIKSDTAYDYLYNWHFVNINEKFTYEQFADYLARDTAVDAYTKLTMMIDSLKSGKLSAEKKKLYLRMVIHIAGDLHQPMHVARLSDLGGNRVRVQWFNQPSNLHRLWDEQLIEFQQLSYTEYVKAINFTTKQQRQTWQQQSIPEWLFETYTHCQHIYAGIKEENPKLSYRYNFDYVEILNSQLLKGGIRLAGILNDIYG
ncbi:MAG: S1/P1 Nuclease [Chitinophagaceae bacterium]|nr:MAG: S1/P1 Nuclease [Chitinophagaceae bacterium]